MIYTIQGKVTKGESSASGKKMNWDGYGSIYHQINFLTQDFPDFIKEFDGYKMATINLLLEKEFYATNWQYTFDKVYWLPNSTSWSEKLSFTKIILKHQKTITEAWLYKAYSSPHKNNKYLVEIIAPEIQNLKDKDTCIIEIDEKYFK